MYRVRFWGQFVLKNYAEGGDFSYKITPLNTLHRLHHIPIHQSPVQNPRKMGSFRVFPPHTNTLKCPPYTYTKIVIIPISDLLKCYPINPYKRGQKHTYILTQKHARILYFQRFSHTLTNNQKGLNRVKIPLKSAHSTHNNTLDFLSLFPTIRGCKGTHIRCKGCPFWQDLYLNKRGNRVW